MSSIVEVTRAEEWIFARLDGDATLMAMLPGGVNQHLIPGSDEMLPGIVVQLQSATDNVYVGANRVDAACTFLVKAIDQSATSTVVATILDRVDVLLNGQSGLAGADGRVLGCVREGIVSFTEVQNAKRYMHLGATYRLWVQES